MSADQDADAPVIVGETMTPPPIRWTGDGRPAMSDPNNWEGGAVPANGDTVVITGRFTDEEAAELRAAIVRKHASSIVVLPLGCTFNFPDDDAAPTACVEAK